MGVWEFNNQLSKSHIPTLLSLINIKYVAQGFYYIKIVQQFFNCYVINMIFN